MTPVSRPPLNRWTDERVERLTATLLRGGVLIAAVVTAIGGAALLVQHSTAVADYRAFAAGPPELRSVGSIFAAALRLDSAAIVQLGLVLLIATPVARVVLALFAFIAQRDRLYAFMSVVVLALLTFGLFFSSR